MYYKVLSESGECVHGGSGRWPLPTRNGDGTWTPGDWWAVEGAIEACVNGLHACRDEQVLAWLGLVLYELEYDGEVLDAGDKCVGRKARLLRRHQAWNRRTARLFACDCAEHVLHLFEDAYPHDKRPRQAIETARRYADDEATLEELDAAWDAALAARDAARDAALAARDAALAARDAAWAAAWDAALYAAWDAALDAALDAAWDARDAERAWQYQRLCEYLEGQAHAAPQQEG